MLLDVIGGCFIGVFFLAVLKAYLAPAKKEKDDADES